VIPNWPATLPQCLEVIGYGTALQSNLLRTAMDTGPAKVRRRSTAGVRPVTGRITVDKTDLATLVAFFDDSTLSGAIRFAWTDPDTGAAVEMRFVSPPQWTAHGAGKYLVALDLEILP
jgi:hypothetical protein